MSTSAPAAIYTGAVMHRRFVPRAHRFRYQGFWLLVNVDSLPGLRSRLLSHNRFNLFSLFDRDHGDGGARPLGDQARALLRAHGIDIGGGQIELLCMPRTLGYSFNPLSIYFCRSGDGAPAALIYEVHNTFGERHSYVLPAPEGYGRHSCPKRFYVSPFLDMDMSYDFTVTPPGDRLAVAIRVRRGAQTAMTACMAGERRALTDRALLGCFLRMPAITLKVIAAIHWEALRLWLKGLKLTPRPQT
jgi:DUF1365 family protein